MNTGKLPFSEDHEADIAAPNLSRGQLTSALIGAVHNIRTLNNLLVTEHRHGDGFTAEMTDSIYDLMERETRIVCAVTNRLSEWEGEYRAERKAEEAERNSVAEGIRAVREAFIGASVEAGVDTPVIASALNIKRSSVERVVARLRGGAPTVSETAQALGA